MKNTKVRRFWSVYCGDGMLWEADLSREVAQIEAVHADAVCDDCDGPHVAQLESETTTSEAQAKAS